MTFLMTDIQEGTRLFQRTPEGVLGSERAASCAAAAGVLTSRRPGGAGDRRRLRRRLSDRRERSCLRGRGPAGAGGERLPEGIERLTVRMAVHTGDVQQSSEEGQYHGIALHHTSRMLTAAQGGQILVSEATASLAPGGGEAAFGW